MQATPARNRLPDTAPAEDTLPIASMPSTSKELRWDSCLPPATRALLQNRETRRRTILAAACAIVLLVILYANTTMTHQKAKLVLEWESARASSSQKTATLHAARASTAPPAPAIPRIMHQSWIGEQPLPAQWQTFSAELRARHPDWEHRMWSDADNTALVTEHYAWLVPFYNSLPGAAQRADMAKYLYMHRFGGVYVSMRAYATRPLGGALLDGYVVLAPSGLGEVSTAYMASEPGQAFWHFVVSKAASYAVDVPVKPEARHDNTGSRMLYRAVHHYTMLNRDTHNITLLEQSLVVDAVPPSAPVEGKPCVLVPVQEFDNATCAAQFPTAVVFVTGLAEPST